MALASSPSNGIPRESMARSATLDYARFLAAVGIIVFHVGAAGANIGYAALPFFLMLLVFLAFPGAERLDFRTYARSRAARLLQPWVVWSLIYGSLKLAEVGLTEATIQSEFALWMLFAGPSLHLWFMPFAYVACLAAWPLAQWSASLSARWQVVCGALGTGLAVLLVSAGNDSTATQPVTQWLHALPAVILGFVFACLRRRSNPALLVATCAVALAGCLWLADWPKGSTQLVIASTAFALCMAVPLPDRPAARRIANLSLTLYLAHPMVISVLLRVTSIQDESPEMAVCAVLGTTLLAILLQRMRRESSLT